MKIPAIGITVRSEMDDDPIYALYAEAVEAAGGRAVFLHPRSISVEEALVMKDLDGLLLSGGRDVHPRHFYSQEELDEVPGGVEGLIVGNRMSVEEVRDEFEIPVAKAALAADLPVFGICRGFQLLNVVMGGKLILDIDSDIQHRSSGDGASSEHMVSIESGTRIAEILGTGSLKVNSRHHQGLRLEEKANDLIATAFAPDGIVEAVESDRYSWVLAVQWHPERPDDCAYEPCRALFKAFVHAARLEGRA